jgi:hydroxymethylpyrimidine/phosphomethylpyrimidine kinase
MLSNAGVVRAVARSLQAWRSAPEQQQRQLPIVIDPVCVSTSGHTLLERDAIGVLVDELLPLATVLTPNLSEAVLLLHHLRPQHEEPSSISSIDGMLRTACELQSALGCSGAVLLKGGHFSRGSVRPADLVKASFAETGAAARIEGIEYDCMMEGPDSEEEILLRAAAGSSPALDPVEAMANEAIVVDVLCEREERHCEYTLFVRPHLDSNSTHGTGCTLSAALACALARGEPRAYPVLSLVCH